MALALFAIASEQRSWLVASGACQNSTQGEKDFEDAHPAMPQVSAAVAFAYIFRSIVFPLWALTRYRNLRSTNSQVVGVRL